MYASETGRYEAGAGDPWATWMLHRRHGDDGDYQRAVLLDVLRYRNRVLDGASLEAGMTLVDVGAGDGLVAFGAIERIGPSLRVVLIDVSEELLKRARRLSEDLGIMAQCTFLKDSAEKLQGLADARTDVVTTRAVLAYVSEKNAALRQFYRVLKPGGRISIAEPIFQDEAFEACALGKAIESQPTNPDIDFLRLLCRYKSAMVPATEENIWRNPLTNFSERDLVRSAQHAGFVNVHMELHIDYRPSLITRWDVFLDVSQHPLAPTPREILDRDFSQPERELFERVMRPPIESGQSVASDRVAYLTATKPPAAEPRSP